MQDSKLINRAKYQVDALRQKFREGVPEELAKAFSRRLKRHEWSTLHKGLAQTDLMHMKISDAMTLLKDPSQVSSMIADKEEALSSVGSKRANKYRTKAKALATYMVTKKPTSRMLLRNAHAIAHLYGEENLQSVPESVVSDIEALVSLYAFEMLDDASKASLSALATEEEAGVQTLVGFLRSVRAMEKQRRDRHGAINKTARNNGWQGYVPSTLGRGASVVLKPTADQAKMERMGYTLVGRYKGDKTDLGEPMSYYQSTVGGRNAFRQGVAQSVHESWQGVDARTGMTKSEYTAGLIAGAEADQVKFTLSQASSLDNLPPGDYLLPIFSSSGDLIGFSFKTRRYSGGLG